MLRSHASFHVVGGFLRSSSSIAEEPRLKRSKDGRVYHQLRTSHSLELFPFDTMAPFVFAQGLKGGPYLPVPILVIPRSSHRKTRPRATCLQPHSRRLRRLRGDHRPPFFNRVPICDASRVIAGTAGHPSFRKTRCGGQIMPICESSSSLTIARSSLCQRFPRSDFLK